MAVFATCGKCGSNVKIGSKNCEQIDGIFYHIKCPRDRKRKVFESEEEKQSYNSLRDRIKKWYTEKPSEYYMEHSLNWQRVIQRINVMKSLGYSYGDIEYTLDKTVEELGAFFGIKQVENRISECIAKRDRLMSSTKDLKKYTSTYDCSVDLSKIQEENWGW